MEMRRTVMQFNACPKCHGTLLASRDFYGEYKKCLQCGYMLDTQKEVVEQHGPLKAKAEPGRKQKGCLTAIEAS